MNDRIQSTKLIHLFQFTSCRSTAGQGGGCMHGSVHCFHLIKAVKRRMQESSVLSIYVYATFFSSVSLISPLLLLYGVACRLIPGRYVAVIFKCLINVMCRWTIERSCMSNYEILEMVFFSCVFVFSDRIICCYMYLV